MCGIFRTFYAKISSKYLFSNTVMFGFFFILQTVLVLNSGYDPKILMAKCGPLESSKIFSYDWNSQWANEYVSFCIWAS